MYVRAGKICARYWKACQLVPMMIRYREKMPVVGQIEKQYAEVGGQRSEDKTQKRKVVYADQIGKRIRGLQKGYELAMRGL